jgi:hypothetical protein
VPHGAVFENGSAIGVRPAVARGGPSFVRCECDSDFRPPLYFSKTAPRGTGLSCLAKHGSSGSGGGGRSDQLFRCACDRRSGLSLLGFVRSGRESIDLTTGLRFEISP